MSSPGPLPDKAADTTAERPWPVRRLSLKIAEYVERMSPLWVEGQVVQLSRRPGMSTCYLTLRDTDVDMSLAISMKASLLDAMPTAVGEGARVVVQAKPSFWTKRGTLNLEARQIRQVGVGELLARLEHLKGVLRAEGLFDAERKQPLPFLPHRVGLVCGRGSAAEKDVVENARRRWPTVQFTIRQVPVQGPDAVTAVCEAVRALDRDTQVDVVVIARGGGSFEDLLPFSNEALLRVVSACRTPTVSAIGHDVDTPLLDFVADVRASTPTDAAKRIVPDVDEQRRGVHTAYLHGQRALSARLDNERRLLQSLRSRPVIADPTTMITLRQDELERLSRRATVRVLAQVERAVDQARHLRAQVRSLSPLSTLERGYAVVQHAHGKVVLDRAEVEVGELLRVRVAHGDFAARPVA